MQFAIISRGDPLSETKKKEAIQRLLIEGFSYNEQEPEVVIAIGGDGTVLHAFHTYKHRLDRSSFISYNTGHLGFYSDWDELDSLLHALMRGKLVTVEYPLVNVNITNNKGLTVYLALNDFTIKGVKGSIQVDVSLNGNYFESFKGDGLCISSPSGSTGYNKSLGGAIVHPSVEMLQLSEMASINNRIYRTIGSSLIIPKHHGLTLIPKEDSYILSVDHESYMTDDVQQVTCSVAKEKIKFLRARSFPFWNRVKEAFISL
ncbi:MAG TPA: NAD kinase [Bacillota bacterium]|nr:NAD kinase [Bacillota bacterium]